jgi:hypothetical protein
MFADLLSQGMTLQRDAYTKFSIGGVLTDTFEELGRNFATLALIALLAQLPAFVFNLLLASVNSSATAFTVSFGFWAYLTGIGAIEALIALACFSIAQAALVLVTVADLSGRRETLAGSLKTAFKSALPLCAITILSTLGIIFGFVLLVIPGTILAVGWIAAVPACIIERKSTFESFRRSWELTGGQRLGVFGLLAIAVVVSGIFLLIIMLLGGALATAAGTNSGVAVLGVIRVLTGCAVNMFSGSLIGVIYYELYFIREGHAPGALASVFD